MTVQELIEKLQQIADKEQEIFVSVNGNDGLDIIGIDEEDYAVFINVYDEEDF